MKEKEYFRDIIAYIKKNKPDKDKLARYKVMLCKKHSVKEIPTDIKILLNAPKKDLSKIRKYLLTKPTRTISGVAVIAIMSKPHPCPHGKCRMCPGGVDSAFGSVPQSYTGKEPAARRAIRNKYNPYLQVMNRLEQYVVTGHMPEKVELIIMGGTFPSYNKIYRDNFVKHALKAMNDFSKLFFKAKKKGSKKQEIDIIAFKKFFELPGDIYDKKRELSIRKKLLAFGKKGKQVLEQIQKENESAAIRCIGMTQETRPDFGMLKHGNEMLRLGTTRVELGIQSVYDSALKRISRGHSVKDNIKSIAILKDLGFKLNFHMMPGLPGITYEMDVEGLIRLFEDENYMPDMLKIYPCMVLKGTKLYQTWKRGKYKPLTTKKAARIIAEFKQYVPSWCRIMRVQRDIPAQMIEAGVDKTNLRQYVQKLMDEYGLKCECIRCREIGRAVNKIGKVHYIVRHYSASGGNEFFISAETKNNILGFCRLRFPKQFLRKEITPNSALIRELHVYGSTVAIGKKGRKKGQHVGIGKKLMSMAEEICQTYYKNKIVVISGIGVREYYKKLGYRKEGCYMVKNV